MAKSAEAGIARVTEAMDPGCTTGVSCLPRGRGARAMAINRNHRQMSRAGRHAAAVLTVLIAASASNLVSADWRDRLQQVTGKPLRPSSSASSTLGGKEIDAGLRDALAVGAERAIAGLGRPGGYLDDPSVRIALPKKLRKLDHALRKLGKGEAVDEFVTTMNRAAEQAVVVAGPIVGDAVREMSIRDAQQILSGPDDAATTYFRGHTSERLGTGMLPIVRRTTAATGVSAAYKRMLDKAGILGDALGENFDLDQYVTDQALDGLFLKLAEEERSIRHDPAARTTELLKRVFR